METCVQQHSALTAGAVRALACGALLLVFAPGPGSAWAQDATPVDPTTAALPYRPAPPLRSYVAVRRMHSTNERHRKDAWLVARTELRADGTFTFQILEEGGSEFIRNRVLREALEKEAEVHKDGSARRGGITAENYEFSTPTPGEGIVRIGLVPRRKQDMLLKGTMVTSAEGELLRVEGELVKRPSFWTKSVHLVRHYGRVGGAHVPVRLDMRAQVRLVGTSTLTVSYEYEQINGQPVDASLRQAGTGAHAGSLARAPSPR